ncbi:MULTISPECIES: alpha/beta hydrolase family protein [Acinetobacter]|uniref:Alpha/beta hydrolase family protein n=1 Tax=Acinetobacter calcoaceticus TaxID=471 RepID=A0A446ZHB0_ACICA|nr:MULTISPECIES: lipase family protein [Acinetobacter]MCU4424200.1 alpha/beta hydrolase [Acinetobacter sp. WU_MDCI_Abxb74]VAX43894.1 Alpha/beta hydrolase family protein [Acinetobacter calcoaceticus]
MKRSKIALAITLSVSALFLAACNDDDDDYTGVNPDKTYVSEKAYSKDSLEGASSIKVMTYNMVNVQGKTAEATAIVMFPKIAQPKDGYRVVVWEHGTVGVGDSCAPSNNTINPRFKILADTLLAAGYVVIAPDYEGLGTRGMHPYLNLGSEAKSAIAAVKAAKDHYGSQLNSSWMSIGQSQGGHASLGTAEFANNDSNYKGAVATAPASSLGDIISIVAPQAIKDILQKEQAGTVPVGTAVEVYAELLAYAAYTTVGITAYEPKFNYREIFQQRSQSIAEFAEGTTGENGVCLPDLHNKFADDIRDFLATNAGKTVLDYPGLAGNFQENPTVKKFLVDNQPATKKINSPVMIVQGTADMAVPYPITEGLQNRLKDKGTDVTFVPVVGAAHTQAIVCRNAEIYQFVQSKMPAKTNIVLDPSVIDASKNFECTGVAQ